MTRERERERDKQRDSETDRQRDRETERQSDRETERQGDREIERQIRAKEPHINAIFSKGLFRKYCVNVGLLYIFERALSKILH